MMDLATHQRILLGLVKSTYRVRADDDPYVHRVAASRDLAEARRNIFLWRIWVLQRSCVLTFALLKQRRRLEEALSQFIARYNISPFRETQGPAFLEGLHMHDDRLIASVAQFELALMKVQHGDTRSFVVDWPCDPHPVLNALANDLPLGEEPAPAAYRIQISQELPYGFEIHRL